MPAVLRDGFDVSSEVLAQAGAVDRQYAQRHESAYEASLALTQPSSGQSINVRPAQWPGWASEDGMRYAAPQRARIGQNHANARQPVRALFYI
jgi:hypothetical protein